MQQKKKACNNKSTKRSPTYLLFTVDEIKPKLNVLIEN